MHIDDPNREPLRALDPATQVGLSDAQRDELALTIVAAWSSSCRLLDDGPSESAVYVRVVGGRR
jgi:hypothetical protein